MPRIIEWNMTSAPSRSEGEHGFLWTRNSVHGPVQICTRSSAPAAPTASSPLYLTYLYQRLPLATTVADLEAPLPWNVKPPLKAAAASNA